MLDGMENFFNWILDHGLAIFKILFLAILYYLIFRIVVWRVVKAVIEKTYKKKDEDIVRQRADTLRDVFIKTGQIVFLVGVFLAVLAESGVNITPLLAGFGVVGIAVGFGAQSLVKDIVNGIFIIFEGQYSKGDIVEIGDKNGKVEDIDLRKTVLRDLDGTVHHIPNSLVGVVSNKSQDWASVNLDIKVGCDENLEKVLKVLSQASKDLYGDEEFSKHMMEEPEVLGVEDIEDSKITIKVVGKTKHLKKWEVAREFRKRIKEAFDKEKIKMV